jgi:hypothetical protein
MMEAFDLCAPEIDVDPFPHYTVLRERYPCYWCESGKLWILSRYDDIVQAARDWETFSSSQGRQPAARTKLAERRFLIFHSSCDEGLRAPSRGHFPRDVTAPRVRARPLEIAVRSGRARH